MVLSDEHIKEFQELCKEHFGIEISKEDARENGTKLLRLISLIYRPKGQKDSGVVVASRTETLIEQKVEKSNEHN
jgi:aldehyde:ferredoxin oxidoreductase